MPLSRGGEVKLRTQWLPVAASLDNNEASLLLLSLYMGKLMGAGKGLEKLKVRVSSGQGIVESRLLGKAEKGWVVGEGVVVVVNNLEERVSLEVIDVQRDKVLGEVIVEVAEDNIALVKRQWGKRAEVCSSFNFFFFPVMKRASPRNIWKFAIKLFPLHLTRKSPSLKNLGGPVSMS